MIMRCNRINIENECAFNSAVYIQSWPNTLKNDDKMTVWRTKKAEEAARSIFNEKG